MKKRIKQIIGVIIGIIIGISTTVGATTIFNSKDITYSSDKTSKTNVKDSLDELYTNLGKCPNNKSCVDKKISEIVELGDYIRMTPTSTSYTPPGELTGCMNDANCTQNTLNPSELNLWRVIKKNEDGTVDAVSVYASSVRIFFQGEIGYKNYIGALNTIASQYTNEKYVKSTRNIGYKNQIGYCTDYIVESCPIMEPEQEDLTLVKNIFGSILARTVSGNCQRYHYPRRQFGKWGDLDSFWVNTIGGESSNSTCECECTYCGYRHLRLENGEWLESGSQGGVRPVITLKSSITINNGDGKSESTAYQI